MSSPQPTAPRLPVAAPSPVNLSPQSNYPPPLQQRPSGRAPSGGAQGVHSKSPNMLKPHSQRSELSLRCISTRATAQAYG